jgi:hypothetical protein
MSTGKLVGRVGALAVALGISFAASAAPGMPVAGATDASPDTTALLVCGGGCPTWRDSDVKIIMNQFITPTHAGETITPVAVTTPSEAWPITGLLRLLALIVGAPIAAPGGAAWPDEPLWKLSGLFDMTANQSTQAGVAALQAEMAAHGGDHLVIYGYSMGANTVIVEKRKLAAQYPPGTTAPDISFVVGGDADLPNGGLAARFPGVNTVILGTFDGAEPTDTQFHTDVITRQYDGAADFPLYPLDVIADLNAVMGFAYIHTFPFDVSLPADPTTSPAYQGTHGDSSYYFFPTEHLPLFAPLRQLGVPEPLIDVVEPFFRVLVEMGYDRSIPPWQPTPARLIPAPDPAKVITDLATAIGQGINNAAALVGLPNPVSDTAVAGISHQRATSTRAPIGNRMSTDTAMTVTQTAATDASAQGARHVRVDETDSPTSRRTATGTAQPTLPSKLAETIKAMAGVSTANPATPAGQRPKMRPVVRSSVASSSAASSSTPSSSH